MDQEQHVGDQPHHQPSDAELRAARIATAPTHSERRRWQAIDLWEAGASVAEMSAATGYQPRTIKRIVQRYRESGAAGLVDGRQRSVGATPLLSPAQQHELHDVLRHPPPDGGAWTGPKVAQWIAAKIGRTVARQRGWDYLHRLTTDTTFPS